MTGRGAVDCEALTKRWAGPALAGTWAGFSWWAGFSRSLAGFFRLALFREILVAKFFDLGGYLDGKSSIPAKIQGIGARKFVEM
jgi:hypothetical protein